MHLEVYNPQPIMLWFAIKEIRHVLKTKYPMNQNMAKSVNKQTCRFGSVFYMHLLQWDAKGFPLPLAWRFVVGWGRRSKNGNIGTPYLNHCIKNGILVYMYHKKQQGLYLAAIL